MSFQRNTNGDDSKSYQKNPGLINKEVSNLMKGNLNDIEAINRIRSKYKNPQMIESIFDEYKRRQRVIIKKARKFKQIIFDRYAPFNLPFHEIIKKAKKYAKKFKMTDDEFQMFFNLAISDKNTMGIQYNLPNTKMSKALGYSAIYAATDKLNIKPEELNVLTDIIKLYGETKTLHSQIVLQSLTYKDCAAEALSGELRDKNIATDRHNFYSYVHPVIAALFIPKIKLLDEHILIANLGYIIKCKKDGNPIMTKPDLELYWDLITDPNDHACSMESAIKDLKNRFILQTHIWDSVLNLRQGHYYNDRLSDFLLAIENCRSNVFDAPDLTYQKDESTIIRRILNAFSIRPTIVSTTRLYGILGTNPYGFGTNPFSAAGLTAVTTVPMITVRLPLNLTKRNQAIDLQEGLSQPQWFVENNMIIPKTQNIIHSRDVLFFYVGRRFKTINIAHLNAPCNFHSLPMTIAGWESLNDQIVNYEPIMTILNDQYHLRSVIFVDSSPSKKNLIIGCSAGIIVPRSHSMGRYQETHLIYDPQGSAIMVPDEDGHYGRRNPISYVSGATPLNGADSFWKRATTRGTLFMYAKIDSKDPFCN